MNCPICGSDHILRNGKKLLINGNVIQKYICANCKKNFSDKLIKEQINMEKNVGISIDEFRKRHDILFIVTNVIKSLNGDMLYEKADLCKLCKLTLSTAGLTSIIQEHKDFEDYRGRIHGKYYWGNPEIIKKLKEEGLLT